MKKTQDYALRVESDIYGVDFYGPYDSLQEAKAGRARIRKAGKGDGVKRTFDIIVNEGQV